MLTKKQVIRYSKKKVVIQVRGSDKYERYYVILVRCDDEGIACVDAKNRSMTFSYSALESVYEMTPRQQEKFDYFRYGKVGIQNEQHF